MKTNNESGFTLVELMVVVAIIGILSAVAVPNFKRYQAKSKTSEGRLQLSAIYTALQSFYSDFDTYHVCLNYMGYNPTNEAAQRYYTTGFNNGALAASATRATDNGASAACVATAGAGTSYFLAAKRTGAAALATNAHMDGTAQASEETFLAGAAGAIQAEFGGATSSYFTINQDKRIIQVRAGY